MGCIRPITIHVNGQNIQTNCGSCINCRTLKQTNIEILARLELYEKYIQGQGASFITLTYDSNYLPENGSLQKKHLQDYHKRIRSQLHYNNIPLSYKHISCGEYGDSFGRAHYHIVFIGLSNTIIKLLGKCWTYGLQDVGPLLPGGLRYVIKYCTKSPVGKKEKNEYLSKNLEPPFLIKSINMGKNYLESHLDEITENNYTIKVKNSPIRLSKYIISKYDKFKQYDKLTPILNNIKEAKKHGYNNYHEYNEIQNFTKAKERINLLRQKQVPYNQKEIDYINHKQINIVKSIEKHNLDIPF